jgi:branched-chain amino acid transport system ATP-binding protein
MTALKSVITGALCRAKNVEAANHQAMKTLEFFGLLEKKDTPARSLTTVDRKRLGLASALATKPNLLLLDEVVAGLNPTELEEVIELLKRIRDSGVTLFVVEHIMHLIMSITDRIVVLHHGEKIAEGKTAEVVKNEKVIEAYIGEQHIA